MSNVAICSVRTVQRMAIAIVYAGCKLEVIASMSTHVAKQQQHQYAPHPAEAYGCTAKAAARPDPPSRPCASTPFRSSPVCLGLCGGPVDLFLLSPLLSLANMYPLRRYFFVSLPRRRCFLDLSKGELLSLQPEARVDEIESDACIVAMTTR